MHTFLLSAENWYLVCFGVGLVLSVLAFVGGFGHLHFGHLHLGHMHAGHAHAGHLHTHTTHGAHPQPIALQRLHAARFPLLVWRSGLSALPFQFVLGYRRVCAGSAQRTRGRRRHFLVPRTRAASQRARDDRGGDGDDRGAGTRLEPDSRGRHGRDCLLAGWCAPRCSSTQRCWVRHCAGYRGCRAALRTRRRLRAAMVGVGGSSASHLMRKNLSPITGAFALHGPHRPQPGTVQATRSTAGFTLFRIVRIGYANHCHCLHRIGSCRSSHHHDEHCEDVSQGRTQRSAHRLWLPRSAHHQGLRRRDLPCG